MEQREINIMRVRWYPGGHFMGVTAWRRVCEDVGFLLDEVERLKKEGAALYLQVCEWEDGDAIELEKLRSWAAYCGEVMDD